MMAYHGEAVRDRLAAVEPEPGFLAEELTLAAKALARRGHGEERMLAPLWGRLERQENPAQWAVRVNHALQSWPAAVADLGGRHREPEGRNLLLLVCDVISAASNSMLPEDALDQFDNNSRGLHATGHFHKDLYADEQLLSASVAMPATLDKVRRSGAAGDHLSSQS